jgi:hypothetical protein
MKRVRGPRASAIAGLALAVAVLVAGCAEATYTYVANTSQNAYFKVPHAWKSINGTALQKSLTGGSTDSNVWTVGFDASGRPSPDHALGTVPTEPFVYATAGSVNSATTDSLSYNVLRDFFLPVTSTTRTTAAKDGFPLTGFKLVSSSNVALSQGVHGVHEIYDYTYPGGTVVTFDQLALTNATATQVYLLVVHCTTGCYAHNQAAINTVMNSFTVRSP